MTHTTTDAVALLDRAAALHEEVQEADAGLLALRDERDDVIRAALAAGLLQREVCAATGLSPGMVARIASGRRASS